MSKLSHTSKSGQMPSMDSKQACKDVPTQNLKKLQFGTNDPECFTEHMSVITDAVHFVPYGPSGFGSSARIYRFPQCAIFELDWKGAQGVIKDAAGFLGFTKAIRGAFTMKDTYDKEESYFGDTGHVIHPLRPFDIRSNESQLLCGTFYPPLLTKFYNKLMANDPSAPIDWTGKIHFHSKESAAFYRYLRFVWSELTRSDSCLDQGFVVQEIENTLMALFAAAIGPSDPRGFEKTQRMIQAAHIRRAEEYIEQSLCQPFSLADLSAACGISIRSLSRKFQERFGMSPMCFVKRRRLEKVRDELRAFDPEDVTVKAIALQYGFPHLSQFAKDYKEAFGEFPSGTLQKKKG
jgi:AraC-like DNA-binding protein